MSAEKKETSSDNQTESFEHLMKTLEDIVQKLESDNIPLEESLKIFEKGILTGRRCEEILNQAEKKIEILQNAEDKNTET